MNRHRSISILFSHYYTLYIFALYDVANLSNYWELMKRIFHWINILVWLDKPNGFFPPTRPLRYTSFYFKISMKNPIAFPVQYFKRNALRRPEIMHFILNLRNRFFCLCLWCLNVWIFLPIALLNWDFLRMYFVREQNLLISNVLEPVKVCRKRNCECKCEWIAKKKTSNILNGCACNEYTIITNSFFNYYYCRSLWRFYVYHLFSSPYRTMFNDELHTCIERSTDLPMLKWPKLWPYTHFYREPIHFTCFNLNIKSHAHFCWVNEGIR